MRRKWKSAPAWRGAFDWGLWRLPVVLEADFKLLDGAINGADGLDTVSAVIVGGVFEVFLGVAERTDGGVDFRMRFRSGRNSWWRSRRDRGIGETEKQQTHYTEREHASLHGDLSFFEFGSQAGRRADGRDVNAGGTTGTMGKRNRNGY